jgi:esterase/lipase
MAKKVTTNTNERTTNTEIINELYKLRNEIASMKASKTNYVDVEIDEVEDTYTFTIDELVEFVNEVQTQTLDKVYSIISMMDFDDCVDIETSSNTVEITVDADEVSDAVQEEIELDSIKFDEDEVLEIYNDLF